MEQIKIRRVYCPICKTHSVAPFPYDSFVKHHRHLIRRYFTGTGWGKWWKQYHEDLAKIKEKENGKI